ncbi:MAG: PcfB family protein [Eubacterium sp.]|nr:PcfB family protein [Eubacterium sp.]MBR3362228.1 PcfB family protein [Lachnospiraceae bacterium]
MGYSGDAAEQVVRMSLNGVEIAAKISGKAAERLAVLLYAVLKDQKKTKGKIRLTSMLKSGRELKVFAVKDDQLEMFSKAAKQYGVLYCVLKDRSAEDGLTDVMVRADDAGKINRIFDRYSLATVDQASVKTEIERSRGKNPGDIAEPERNGQVKDKVDEFMKKVVPDKNPTAEKAEAENPTQARNAKSSQSGHSSVETEKREPQNPERSLGEAGRPSVRKQLEEIRKDMDSGKTSDRKKEIQKSNRHKAPKKKRRRYGKEAK